MQTHNVSAPSSKLNSVAKVLRITGWVGLWSQLALAALSIVFLILAIGGRNFNQAIAPNPSVPGGAVTTQTTTPGLGIGIFWAVCGLLVLFFNLYLAFRQTRYGKRLRNPNPAVHPSKAEVMKLLRFGVIASLVGMFVTILGGGATLGVLLSKAIAQPQGVAIYDPARIIRSLDVFVAMANMSGITAHFIGVVASLALFNWLHHQHK